MDIQRLQVETTQERQGERVVTALRRGSPLWHVARAVGEQTLLALDELGYVRTDALGRVQGFRVKELAVTPDGARAVVHLDVTSVRLFEPGAPAARRGKPVPYLSLIHNRVVEQVRVRVSELLGRPVEVWADNHFYVRYVADLRANGEADPFPTGELTDWLEAAPGPLCLPLGLDRSGRLVWLDWVATPRHILLTGATGGGKTTWMDAALCTLVRRTPPEQLKLVCLDPQRLNFSPYRALQAHHFADAEGPIGVVWQPGEIAAAMARLNREHLRRVARIGETPWASLEQFNAHVPPKERLPYVAVFADELALLRKTLEQAGRSAVRAFESALGSLIVGGRKVGFRLVLCLQYLKGSLLPPEIAAQAALTLAFWNSPQGSKNSLGDTAAALLPGRGRFIVEGLPASPPALRAGASGSSGLSGGRQVLQGLHVDRETVLALVGQRPIRHPVDSLVLDILAYALQELEGQLPRDGLKQAFGHLMSQRQLNRLLEALERVGLATPVNRASVPPQPRRLTVDSVEAAIERLAYHPEIGFHHGGDGNGLIFGRQVGSGRQGAAGPPPRSAAVRMDTLQSKEARG